MAKKSAMREKAKKKAERNMNRSGGGYIAAPEGTEFIKPKKGPYNWDFLPYVVKVNNHPEVDKGEQWYQRTFWVHYNVGSDNKAYICPKTIKKPCPICEYVKELYNSDEDENIELAKQIKAKERELYNVIDLDDQDKGVQIFEYSYHLFGKALDEEINEGDDELGGFAELEGGQTLQVSFRKKKFNKNEFYEVRKIDFEEREDYDEDILEDVYDLDSLLVLKDYDFLQKELFGSGEEEEEGSKKKDDDDDDDEKEEEKPKKSGKKSSKKKKDDDDDDDDVDEKPKRGKKSGKKKKDDDDNEKEEEKPKKSGKKSGSKKSEVKKKSSENECPHGGTFGEDTDELDECENCDKWTECQEKYEELHEEE